jgi:putative ABC transport system permease protein
MEQRGGRVSHELGPLLKKEFPVVKDFVRFSFAGEKHLFHHGDNAFYWENTYYADNSVFKVFTHKIIYGDPASALIDKTSIAVSESFARKYFGDENPIGKLISDDVFIYKISVVFADLPENTQFKYDVLLPHKENADPLKRPKNVLLGSSDVTYLLMPEGYKVSDFDKISESLFERYMDERYKQFLQGRKFWLQPITDIHLKKYGTGMGTVHYYLYAFSAVAVFILLVACINYINLAIARATKRSKEVGMRKILGSDREKLIFLFTGESVFFSLISLFLGLALAEACLKLTTLNELIGKTLSLNIVNEPEIILWMIAITIVFRLLSGL